MAEITGGELNYSVTVDVDQLKKGMSDAEGNIQGFSTMLEKFGQKADDVFFALGQNAKNQDVFLKNLETQFSSIAKVIESLRDTAKGPILAEGLDIDKAKLQEIEPYLKAYEEKYTNLKNELISLQSEMSSISELRSQERQEIDALKRKSEEYQSSLEELKKSLINVVPGELPKVFKEVTLEVDKAVVAFKSASDVKIDFGLTKENLSIQKQVIAEIKSNIDEIEKRAKGMAPGMAQASVLGEIGPLKAELAAEEKALIDLQTELSSTKEKQSSLTTERNKALDVMRRLTLENKQGTDEYKQAEKAVVEYNTAITQANEKAKVLSSGGLAGMIQNLSLATSVLATGQAVMGVFAGENEDLNKIMLKSQALLSATIALQQLHTTVVNKGVFGVTSLATAKTALSAANTRLAVSLGISNLAATALMATLTLGLSVVITGVIIALNKLNEKHKENAEINKKVADSLAEPLVAYRKLQIQWNSLGNDLNSKKKFITENADEFQGLGVQINNVQDAEKLLKDQTAAFEASMIARAKAAAYAQVAVEDFKKALDAQNEVDDFNAQWKDAGFFGSIGLGAKAIFTNMDDTKAGKLTKRGEGNIKKQIEEEIKADQKLREAGLKAYERTKTTNNRTSGARNANTVADEYFPPGSVAEIQKRMAAIDEALSKATNSADKSKLKNQRIQVAEELAAALKSIEIKSLEDRANEQEKYSIAYGVIAEKYGKETADKMYAPLMEGAQSYFGWLTNEQDKLLQKQGDGILSDKEKANLVFLTQKIDEIEGKKNAFQNFTNGIDEALAKIPTLAGQIEFIQNKAEEQLSIKGNKSFDDGEQKYFKEQEELRLKQLKDNYQSFLNEHKNYEEQKKAITDKYSELRKQAETPEAVKKIDKAEKVETSVLELNYLKESDDWKMAFGDVEMFTQNTIERILANLIKYRDEKKEALNPTEERELAEAILRLQVAASRNPFTQIVAGLKEMKTARIAVIAAEKEYQVVLAANNGNAKSDAAVSSYKKLTDAEQKAADSKNKFIAGVQKGQAIFNAAGEGVLELGDAFGGLSDATKDAIGDIMAIGNAAMDFATSLASGDVAGMIKAGIQLITSVFKALSGDKKKEREIKKQAEIVKILENAYNDLAFAAERAIGAQKYDASRDMIKNIEQQKIAIEAMMKAESSKKKADKNKISEYQQALKDADKAIQELKEGIVKDVLQTGIPEMASQMGDALVDAFGRGEDGVLAINNAFDDLVKNILKNQLNKVLEKQMSGVYESLLAAAGFDKEGNGTFNGFTDAELAELRSQYQLVAQNGEGLAAAIAAITGATESVAQGMKGDIKGITEKTAGALESYANVSRIMKAEDLAVQRNNQQIFIQSLQNLVMIEANTRPLHRIDKNIEEMNSKMNKGLAGL